MGTSPQPPQQPRISLPRWPILITILPMTEEQLLQMHPNVRAWWIWHVMHSIAIMYFMIKQDRSWIREVPTEGPTNDGVPKTL